MGNDCGPAWRGLTLSSDSASLRLISAPRWLLHLPARPAVRSLEWGAPGGEVPGVTSRLCFDREWGPRGGRLLPGARAWGRGPRAQVSPPPRRPARRSPLPERAPPCGSAPRRRRLRARCRRSRPPARLSGPLPPPATCRPPPPSPRRSFGSWKVTPRWPGRRRARRESHVPSRQQPKRQRLPRPAFPVGSLPPSRTSRLLPESWLCRASCSPLAQGSLSLRVTHFLFP